MRAVWLLVMFAAACARERDVEVTIEREVMLVEGFAPPPNPVSGAETPTELNATRVLRYHASNDDEARAVVIAMPGQWAGATSLEPLAKALVQRGIDAGEPIEFWAIDRRSNLIEDHDGFARANEQSDAAIASEYYLEGAPYRDDAELSFMSEWGLETHVEDTRRVIERVPSSKERVVLLGHSLGAMFARAFAGWRFPDGTRGSDLVAGVVLVDSSPYYVGLSPTQYVEGAAAGFDPSASPLALGGLDAIRAGRVNGNPAGPKMMAALEVSALRAKLSPDEIVAEPLRDMIIGLVLGLDPASLPRLTNRTAIALLFDESSTLIPSMALGIGSLDGPVEIYPNPLTGGDRVRPADPDGEYGWIESDAADTTRLDVLVDALASPDVDMLEWYFPSRLELDVVASVVGDFPEDGFFAEQGLRLFEGDTVDVPVLAIAAELVTPADYEQVRSLLAPIGEGRPASGAARDDERAFRIVEAPQLTHFDATMATDGPLNPIPAAAFDFVRTCTVR